jgi:hypothetical protein
VDAVDEFVDAVEEIEEEKEEDGGNSVLAEKKG